MSSRAMNLERNELREKNSFLCGLVAALLVAATELTPFRLRLLPPLDYFTFRCLDDIPIRRRSTNTCITSSKPRGLDLYCKASKCELSVKRVGFLGFMILVNHVIASDVSVTRRGVLADSANCNRPTGYCENSFESGNSWTDRKSVV